MNTQKIRFYIPWGNHKHNLKTAGSAERLSIHVPEINGASAIVEREGAHLYIEDFLLPDPRIAAAVTHMTIKAYIKAKRIEGHYAGEGWEADLSHVNGGTTVFLLVQGNSETHIRQVFEELTRGNLRPSFVPEDQEPTSGVVEESDDKKGRWLRVWKILKSGRYQ